jgi:hypothetical protein
MFTKTDMENLPFVDHFRPANPWDFPSYGNLVAGG